MMELYQLTIHELQDRLRAGQTTSAEIAASVFGRIDAVEKEVRAYITPMRETALAEAKLADEAIKRGAAQKVLPLQEIAGAVLLKSTMHG